MGKKGSAKFKCYKALLRVNTAFGYVPQLRHVFTQKFSGTISTSQRDSMYIKFQKTFLSLDPQITTGIYRNVYNH